MASLALSSVARATGKKRLPGGSQPHRTPVAVQQLNPELLLQPLNLGCDGRLREVKVLGCVYEALPLGNRDERGEMPEFQWSEPQ